METVSGLGGGWRKELGPQRGARPRANREGPQRDNRENLCGDLFGFAFQQKVDFM